MQFKKIGIIYNPISGAGRSERTAHGIAQQLTDKYGCTVDVVRSAHVFESGPEVFLSAKDVVLLAGGDGTLQRFLPSLVATKTPVYMLPTGNESLFARAFGMSRHYSKLEHALLHGTVEPHYLAEANGNLFFTMISVGLDAQVVAEIASQRVSPIGHRGYVGPTLRCLARHTPPVVSLEVDGDSVIDRQRGFLIVANSPQYALGVRYTPGATSTTPGLVARFIPYRSIGAFIAKSIPMLLRVKQADRAGYTFSGDSFSVEVENGPYPVQADGESFGETPTRVSAVHTPVNVLRPRL